jgi:hypothetical protein
METHHSFSTVEAKFCEMAQFLQSDVSKGLDLSGIETFLFHDGRDLLRHLLLAHLAERGPGDLGMTIMGADKVERRRTRPRSKAIKTMFGKVHITRLAYSAEGVESLFPLDAMLNLSRLNISYTLQHYLVLELVKSSFVESLQSIKRWTGVSLTKSQAKSVVFEAAQYFQPFYQERCRAEAKQARSLPLLVLTSDGKGVMMKWQDLRRPTQQRALRKRAQDPLALDTPRNRYSKRMATVASVYEIDRYPRTPQDIVSAFFPREPRTSSQTDRPSPSAKRLWASLRQSSETVITTIFHEAMQRDPDRMKDWVVCVDGDLNQIKQFQRLAKRFEVRVTIICDIVHVLEYLWKAGKVLYSEAAVTEWVQEKLSQMLAGNAQRIAAGMRRSATCRGIKTSTRKPLDTCARYLRNHAPYLRYQDYLSQGYPIASGIIEGACRCLIKDRMEITGARWSLKGAEALLQLRAIHLSGDLDTYWQFYEQNQYQKNYAKLYENPSILQGPKCFT